MDPADAGAAVSTHQLATAAIATKTPGSPSRRPLCPIVGNRLMMDPTGSSSVPGDAILLACDATPEHLSNAYRAIPRRRARSTGRSGGEIAASDALGSPWATKRVTHAVLPGCG